MIVAITCKWFAAGVLAGGLLAVQHTYHVLEDNAVEVRDRLAAVNAFRAAKTDELALRTNALIEARAKGGAAAA